MRFNPAARWLLFALLLTITGKVSAQVKPYAGFTNNIGISQNTLIDGAGTETKPATYYNAFKAGVHLSKNLAIGVEYASFIYRWTNRKLFYNFDEEDWQFASPTKGRKVNCYKIGLEYNPDGEDKIILIGGIGYADYRHFDISYEDHGLVLSGGMNYMFSRFVGFSASVYSINYVRRENSGNFFAVNAGLIVRTTRQRKQSEE